MPFHAQNIALYVSSAHVMSLGGPQQAVPSLGLLLQRTPLFSDPHPLRTGFASYKGRLFRICSGVSAADQVCLVLWNGHTNQCGGWSAGRGENSCPLLLLIPQTGSCYVLLLSTPKCCQNNCDDQSLWKHLDASLLKCQAWEPTWGSVDVKWELTKVSFRTETPVGQRKRHGVLLQDPLTAAGFSPHAVWSQGPLHTPGA